MNNYEIIDLLKPLNIIPKKITELDKDLYLISEKRDYILSLYCNQGIEILKSKSLKANYFKASLIHGINKYYLYPVLKKNASSLASIYLMRDVLKEIYKETEYKYIIADKKNSFYKVDKVLDNRFVLLEMNMRILETSSMKGDYTFLYLEKYHYILSVKKELIKLENEINKDFSKEIFLKYVVLHNDLSFDSYKEDMIDGYYEATFGYYVNDLAKLYINSDHLDIKWFEYINGFLETNFDKRYFKFMVLYLYILNLEVNELLNIYALNKYLHIVIKIKEFMKCFEEYK